MAKFNIYGGKMAKKSTQPASKLGKIYFWEYCRLLPNFGKWAKKYG
jgi:hypothetical protein